MARVNIILIISMFFYLMVSSVGGTKIHVINDKLWCVAKDNASDDVLQKGLDWVCSQDASDCRTIQDGQSCYIPNTLKNHASVAFHNHWKKHKGNVLTCDFNSAAKITNTDPSSGSCQYI
ncbi:CBM43-containing protein [Zostera marina]|uniref:CBM43-containing protein n=1 Tax=Zostera marina TaxID=29655 RepID=A0A0K9P7U8_ZOSMR|nr:CBM43-containing protein [Zostera marina]